MGYLISLGRFLAAAGGLFMLNTAVHAEISFSPAKPSSNDPVTITVTREFEADCLWRIEPDLRRYGAVIELKLDVSGAAGCEGVITNMSFDVKLGRLPVGTYVVRVRWSDGRRREMTHLTVCAPPGD